MVGPLQISRALNVSRSPRSILDNVTTKALARLGVSDHLVRRPRASHVDQVRRRWHRFVPEFLQPCRVRAGGALSYNTVTMTRGVDCARIARSDGANDHRAESANMSDGPRAPIRKAANGSGRLGAANTQTGHS
jgi:hypothetical protein